MKIGDKVKFTDPDGGLSTGEYTLLEVCGDIYILVNNLGGELEALRHELKLIEV